jgi:hypothetical protein
MNAIEIEKPVTRPLKAYAFDPSAGKLLGNEMSVVVPYHDLEAGPVVRDPWYDEPADAKTRERINDAIAVVDYDGANGTYYKPVNLDDPRILIRGGLDPTESDPRFHQQMVYAVVADTIEHFETALGRRIHWRRAERNPDGPPSTADDIRTLYLYPHAFIGRNAFYSPRAHGILFGYFRADEGDVGRNLPGQTVFTCLSHDIVVHETTHAVVDGIRAFFTERTNPDVLAFHEAFADLAALFRHFTHKEVLLDTIQRTGGALYRYQLRPDASPTPEDQLAAEKRASGDDAPVLTSEISGRNPLIELAAQFGEATGKQKALRSALGTKPNSDDIKKITEPHLRGSILVAAVFDAFFTIYLKRTADLWKIYRAGGGNPNPIDVPEPLAERLADEATRLAETFFQICARSLDYCPPVDITFGDFLRAVITADFDLHPHDAAGVRHALMQAFRMRGIVPQGATSFSEGAIAWPRARRDLPAIPGLEFGDPNGLTKEQKDKAGDALRAYIKDPATREMLGFEASPEPFIPSFHPVFRINPDGSLRTDMVVEIVQTVQVPFDESNPALGSFPLRGGVTLIVQRPLAHEGGDPVVRYAIGKHLRGEERKTREGRQRRHLEQLGLTEGNDAHRFQVNFAMVHGGI